MVFKKTEGLSTRVRPNGMPDLSGYKAAAAQYDRISDVMYGLGADMRRADFNEAILEAEAAGRTAGATYDADKNLVPLTNLDLSEAIESQVFGNSEKSALRAAYRKAALSTYAANINLDAKTVATNALMNNPGEPDAVRGALDGYIQNLGVEDEVLAHVMPNIVAQFTAAESQANAQMIQAANAEKERVMLSNIDDLSDRISVIVAKGSGTDTEAAAGHQQMIAELYQGIEESYDTLRTVGYKNDQIDALREGIASKVATEASKAHVERIYTTKGLSAALSEIEIVRQEFAEDPNIDGEAVANEMKNHVTRLAVISNAQEKEQNDAQRDVYESSGLSVALGEITTKQEILALPIGDAEKTSLISQLNSYQSSLASSRATLEAARKAARLEMFDTFMISIKNPQNYSESEIISNRLAIVSMWERGDLSAAKYSEFETTYGKYLDAEMKAYNKTLTGTFKEKGDSELAYIRNLIGPANDFEVTPEWLANKKQDLIERGIVGTGDNASMTRQAWETMVSGYLKKRETYMQTSKDLFLARAAVKATRGTSTQISLVQNSVSAKFIPDETGAIFTHSDPTIREKNFDIATRFFLSYQILPAELQAGLSDLEGAAEMSQEAFDVKLQLFNKIFESVKRGTAKGGTTDLAMPELLARHVMNKQGINVSDYELAASLGRKAFRDSMATQDAAQTSVRRLLNNFDNAYPDLRSAIKGQFKDAVQGPGYLDAFINNFVPYMETPNARELNIINRLRKSGPEGMAGDIDDAYIGDDRLLRLVELSVLNQFATGQIQSPTEAGLKQAIMNAVAGLSDDGKGNALVGISVDSDNNPYWSVYPWYDAAKKSFGDVPVDDVGAAVFNDIRQKVLSPDFMIGERQTNLLRGDGQIILSANTAVGGDQRYTVSVVDPDTQQAYTVLSDYRFDFKTSQDNAVYQLALASMQSDKIRRFMASIPMMKSVVVGNAMEEIKENYDDLTNPSTFSKVMEFIVQINPFYEFADGPERSFSPSERADLEVLFRFMNGELRGEMDVLEARRKYDE